MVLDLGKIELETDKCGGPRSEDRPGRWWRSTTGEGHRLILRKMIVTATVGSKPGIPCVIQDK